jgi:hypothetical protein
MATNDEAEEQGAKGGGRAAVRDVLGVLSSFRFAIIVVALLTLACIAGSVLPQGEQVARYLEVNPGAHGRMQVLAALGLTHVYSSWWFVALLLVFAASLLACTARRYGAVRRATGPARLRVLGSFMTHVSMLLILLGGGIRVIWGEKGVLAFREGDTVTQFELASGAKRDIPFALHLKDFEIEMYAPPEGAIGTLRVAWPEKGVSKEFPVALQQELVLAAPGEKGAAFRLRVMRYVPDLVVVSGANGMEVVSRSDEPRNPAIQVQFDGGQGAHTEWVYGRDVGGHGGAAAHSLQFRFVPAAAAAPRGRMVKAYKSTVIVRDGGREVREAVLKVNAPLSYGGYTFYQSGYNPADPAWTSLQVVRDPGVSLVLTGFVLMLAGLTAVFCVTPGSTPRTPGTGARS